MQQHWSARAPVRIDLAGGTLDIWPIYAILDGCVTVNLAIPYYQHITCTPADRWMFTSNQHPTWQPDTLHQSPPPTWAFVTTIVRYFAPPQPLHVHIQSDVPPGSGLGGSSALAVALIATLARMSGMRLTRPQIVRMAAFLETQSIRVPTGLQDYLAAVYGSCHAWEWQWSGWRAVSLRRHARWLIRHLTVIYVGESRFSGQPNWEVFQRFIGRDRTTRNAMRQIREAADRLVRAIDHRDFRGVARAIRMEMDARRRLHPEIVPPSVAAVLDAHLPGVAAAKVCGAGGGGCVALWSEPSAIPTVQRIAQDHGWTVLTLSQPGRPLRVVPSTGGSPGASPAVESVPHST